MLVGKHIQLREIEESDLSYFRDWRNSPHIRKYTRGFRPLNMLNQKKWLESLIDNPSATMFAITNSLGKLLGCCGLVYINFKEGSAETSLYMSCENWRDTIEASEVMQLLLMLGFRELRLHRIYAVAYEYDEESKAFLEKNGFIFEGIHREARFWDGSFWDERVYGMLENEYAR